MTLFRLARRGRAAVVPLMLIVVIAVAGTVLGRVYDGPLLAHLVTGAAVGSVAVGALARRRAAWLVAPLSVLAMAGYVVLSLWLAARRAELPGPLDEVIIDAAGNGIPRLLTAMIPVEPVPDTVLIPVVGGWLAGLAATELAVRYQRVLLGYAPPLLLFAAALFVVGPNAGAAIWPSLTFIAATAVGLAVTPDGTDPPEMGPVPAPVAETGPVPAAERYRAGERVTRLRAGLGSVAGVAAVLVPVLLAAPTLTARVRTTPVDPRGYVTSPQVDSLDENPLIRISGWALNPDQRLFEVSIGAPGDRRAGTGTAGSGTAGRTDPDAAESLRIRLAVLPDYDGVTWRVGGTYRSAGRVLPQAGDTGVEAAGLRQEITVADLTGRLLPAAATPARVDGVRVAYDAGSGTLIRPEGLTAGLRYTVHSVPRHAQLNALASADVPVGEPAAGLLRLADDVPDQVRRLADHLARENGAPYQRALAVEQFLAEHYRVVADAPSGHAYPNLAFFLFGPREAGGQRGTSEQFAAAYALLGRLMGLPTRVVVGFSCPAQGGVVRGADAVAWPEVLFSGIGWVPFHPLPRPDTEPQPVEQEFRPEPVESTPPPSAAPVPSVEPTASAAPARAAPPPGRAPYAGVAVVVGSLVLLVAVAVILGVPGLRRAQRRRRLGAGAPADRIIGAWLEVLDALRLAGHRAPGHLSASEVCAHARVVAGSAPSVVDLDELAAVLNHAAFGSEQVDGEQAQRAGRVAVEYADALRARRSSWRRAVWSLRPGPLRWHL